MEINITSSLPKYKQESRPRNIWELVAFVSVNYKRTSPNHLRFFVSILCRRGFSIRNLLIGVFFISVCLLLFFFMGIRVLCRALLIPGTGNGERGTGNGERGTGNGERGTGNGERGTGNGERGTGNGGLRASAQR